MADPQCVEKPPAVEDYLRAHREWAIVTLKDLEAGDRETWREYRKDFCPGIAAASLDGGAESYGMALMRRADGKIIEQLVLLLPEKGKFREHVAVAAAPTPNPFVIHRDPPGKYRGFGSSHAITIPHDTISYEWIGSSSTSLYMAGGKLRSLQTSD